MRNNITIFHHFFHSFSLSVDAIILIIVESNIIFREKYYVILIEMGNVKFSFIFNSIMERRNIGFILPIVSTTVLSCINVCYETYMYVPICMHI